eukprot:TRINITY_DN16246_c0_g1_i4.p1 TRINITY_DN16246_c0_g1~~TRINITY_DN16246_c0_g1_i4.p1  ORF type:complete len:161 (-),score=15.39 TRINITY_DN16246_c0_g1_i4:346-828(-)
MGSFTIIWREILKWIVIVIGCIMVVFGVIEYVHLGDDIKWYEFWMVFYPAYSIAFGIILIISELKPEWLTNYLYFMNNYFGQGCFEIYLAAIPLSGYNSLKNIKAFMWILCALLLFVGGFHILAFCCLKKKLDEVVGGSKEPLVDKPTSDTAANLQNNQA